MKTKFIQLLSLVLFQSIFAQPNVDLELIASGFDMPLSIRNAGDSRLFVVERFGYIKVLNNDGSVNSTPFLNIESQVADSEGIGQEGGLLGLAFHPDYQNNGYFYVHYTDNLDDTVISRFTVDPANPNLADSNSEMIVLTVDQPFPNHNGGDLAFGPDGYLYIALGDGGTFSDSANNGQRLDTLMGKILRINIDGPLPYSVPSDNPFRTDGDPNTLEEIWAYGLRNPWRISFDSLTGDLWIADVGQGTREEINLQPVSSLGGENYGWRCYEGYNSYNLTACASEESMTFPIAEYPHVSAGPFRCSITGGYRYRGNNIPGFYGIYFFADHCSNDIGTLSYDGLNWNIDFSASFGEQGFAGFGEDQNNELYVAALTTGNIYKVVEETLSDQPQNFQTLKLTPNPADDMVHIHGINNILHWELSDILGKRIQMTIPGPGIDTEISLSGLAKGLYIVSVLDASGQLYRRKLIKK